MKNNLKEKDFEKQVREIYTPLSVAKKEIWKRWNDKKLKKKVEDFLGGDIPEFLGKEPKAVFVRDVISPITELNYFLDLAKCSGLKPAMVEYSKSKFVGKNSNKYHLCKMFFYNGLGKKKGDKIDTQRIVDFNKYEGKNFKEIKTLWGENFVDFHHKLLKKSIPEIDKKNIFDFSDWFNKHRKESKYYYLHYLALFLAHGILFENFILNKEEKEFTEKKIIPSFRKLMEVFGIKPLVVPLSPIEDEDELYWWCYPGKTKIIFDQMIKNKNLK